MRNLGLIMPKMGIKRITPARTRPALQRSSLTDALFAGTQQRLLALLFGQPSTDRKRTGCGDWSCRRLVVDIAYDLTYAMSASPSETDMTHLTASEARASLYRLIDQAAESHQPVLIAGKRRSAVLVSAEDWQAIQETLYLLSISGMRESIRKSMAEPLAGSAKELRW